MSCLLKHCASIFGAAVVLTCAVFRNLKCPTSNNVYLSALLNFIFTSKHLNMKRKKTTIPNAMFFLAVSIDIHSKFYDFLYFY